MGHLDNVLKSEKINFQSWSLERLKSKIDSLESKFENGNYNVHKANNTANVFNYLCKQIKEVVLSEIELAEFEQIKNKFTSIAEKMQKVRGVLQSERVKKFNQKYDIFFRKIHFPFDFFDSKTPGFNIIVDKDKFGTYPMNFWNKVYIQDQCGRQWSSPVIPMGSRELTETANELYFFCKTKKNEKIKPLPLPNNISSKILAFIQLGKPDQAFCCIDFVKLIRHDYENLTYVEFEGEKKLSPGDVICLTHMAKTEVNQDLSKFVKENYSHFAIYLGGKVYLSVFGICNGPLAVSSLEKMQEAYKTKDVVVIKN